jgi:hypothetical protein
MLSVYGIAMVAVWLLSPLGGQASLRVLTLEDQSLVSSATFNYTQIGGSLLSVGYGGSGQSTPLVVAQATFQTAIMSSAASKQAATDIWGNVKIPLIEQYEIASPDHNDWFSTNSGNTTYASLLGIPMLGTNKSRTSYDMHLEAKYMYFNCAWSSYIPTPQYHYDWMGLNSTLDDPQISSSSAENDEESQTRNHTSLATLRPRTGQVWSDIGQASCTVTTSYVEVKVTCSNLSSDSNVSTAATTACSTTQVRRSQLDHPPAAQNYLDDEAGMGWALVVSHLTTVFSRSSEQGTQTPFDLYMQHPDNVLTSTDFNPVTGTDSVNMTSSVLSTRLSQMVNTLHWALSAPYAIPGGVEAIGYIATPTATSDGTQTVREQVMVCHYPWLVAVCLASGVMILASLIPSVMRAMLVRGPGLLLNISSLATRDNKFFPLPTSGTYLDGADRAKLVKGMRVRFGDAEAPSGIGRLVIGLVDEASGDTPTRVKKGRLYE